MSPYKCLAFDLDDTLIDTSGLLVPQAAKQTYEAMTRLGLRCTFEQSEEMRTELAKSMSHKEIFFKIAEKYSDAKLVNEIGKIGVENFYNPQLPEFIPLMEGAQETLNQLKSKYKIYLVTSGSMETQRKKVLATKTWDQYQKVYLLDGFKNEKKTKAFEEIIREQNIKPTELLSIGNRLHVEIRQAKMCGGRTCYFKYGEHVGEQPEQPEDHPDYTVLHMRDLIRTCQL